MDVGEVQGETIGEVDAEEVNAASAWLAAIGAGGEPAGSCWRTVFTEAMVERLSCSRARAGIV